MTPVSVPPDPYQRALKEARHAKAELEAANARIARLEDVLSKLVAMDTEHDRLKKIGDSNCAYYAFVKWQTPKWDEARKLLEAKP